MQFVVVPGRCTTDAIFIVRQLQEKCITTANRQVYFAFTKLEKAFGPMLRKILWWALRSLGVDECAVHVIHGMFHNARSRVRVNNPYSESLAWELQVIRALSLAHCSSSWRWKCYRVSSALVFHGSFSLLMTWCFVHKAWQACTESKALHVNMKKTKFMVYGVGLDVLKTSGKCTCVSAGRVSTTSHVLSLQAVGPQDVQQHHLSTGGGRELYLPQV